MKELLLAAISRVSPGILTAGIDSKGSNMESTFFTLLRITVSFIIRNQLGIYPQAFWHAIACPMGCHAANYFCIIVVRLFSLAKEVQRLRPEAFVHPSGTTRINVRERAPSNIFEGIQIMPVDRYFSGSEMNPWFFLSVAIVSEVIAASALKSSNGFTQLWPSLIVITGYGAAFFFLSLALHTIPVGIAYAVWSGGASCL